jgi:hypothetical protein
MFFLSLTHGFWSASLPRTISARGVPHPLRVVLLTAAALKRHPLAIGSAQENELFHCRTLLVLICPST